MAEFDAEFAMSKGLFGKARLQLIYRRILEAGEMLLDLIRTRDFRSVYQEFLGTARTASGT